jgi:hypothetical protein
MGGKESKFFSDACNSASGSRLTNTSNTDVVEAQLKAELYPNPTNDKFSIVTETADAQLSIQILYVQGKVMFTDTIYVKNYETTVQANLGNGVYIVHITNINDGQKTTKKLVVQK